MPAAGRQRSPSCHAPAVSPHLTSLIFLLPLLSRTRPTSLLSAQTREIEVPRVWPAPALLTLCSFWANPRPHSARDYLWVGDPAISFPPTPPSELCPFPAPPLRRTLQTLSSSAQEAISWNILLQTTPLHHLQPIFHSANTVGEPPVSRSGHGTQGEAQASSCR